MFFVWCFPIIHPIPHEIFGLGFGVIKHQPQSHTPKQFMYYEKRPCKKLTYLIWEYKKLLIIYACANNGHQTKVKTSGMFASI